MSGLPDMLRNENGKFYQDYSDRDGPAVQNIADLKDPNDKQGRTYREVNRAKKHKLPVGDRVSTSDGMVLFITKHTRDCDETPLYTLGNKDGAHFCYGYGEDSLSKLDGDF